MAKKASNPAYGEFRIGVYPGTFDPITNGHIDIISRAVKLIDKLVVGVAVSAGKGPLFTLRQRVEMCEVEIAKLKLPVPVEVRSFDTLQMEFVTSLGAAIVIRGLRAVSDFEYEYSMAGMNARLNPRVETVFLMASERNQFISSKLVKEIALLGGDVSSFIPAGVNKAIRARAKTT